MTTGVCFASTGGTKIMRAVRSLRRAEPDLPIHVVLDVMSGTYRSTDNKAVVAWLIAQPNVQTFFHVDSTNHWINGTLNAAMRRMDNLGHSHAALFHDDVVFSPLPVHRGHLTEWFDRTDLPANSGLTINIIEAFSGDGVRGQPGTWHRPSEWWDAIDLESTALWDSLCPNGKPAGYFAGEGPDGGPVGEIDFGTWFVHFYSVSRMHVFTRLGPSGQIVSMDSWKAVGGFDEKKGLVYDMDFPVACRKHGLPPVYAVPSIPHLHLHNQSIGFNDAANGVWGDVVGAFQREYGCSTGEFWKEWGYGVT